MLSLQQIYPLFMLLAVLLQPYLHNLNGPAIRFYGCRLRIGNRVGIAARHHHRITVRRNLNVVRHDRIRRLNVMKGAQFLLRSVLHLRTEK